MLRTELLEIITNGENSKTEFKRDDVPTEKLAKEVVAMVNFQGGRVLLGVEDDGTVSGIIRPDLEEWVMNVFSSKIHPMILPHYEEVQMDNDKRVAVISFFQGISKPYVLRHAGREEVYIRVGTTSRLATREQQARLYEIGGLLHTETMPVPGTTLGSLDMIRLENYIQDILKDPDVPENDDQWKQRLIGLGFMVETSYGETVATIAGLVLFGINPRRYLRQAGMRIMAFQGIDKTYQALLDEVLDGPLVGRFNVDEAGKRELLDNGLIETTALMIHPFITLESETIDAQTMQRTKQSLYPIDAIREVVTNACVHRDWTRFVDIEIGIYSDHFETISPGALQNSMTLDKMKAGQRSPRNTIIVGVMRDYGYVDARGMGIRTKVIPQMRRINNTEPVFELTDDYLKVLLLRQ